MSAPRVVGLDLSLTATGVARADGTLATVRSADAGVDRLATLRDLLVVNIVQDSAADLVVIEGPSYGNQGSARQSGHHERAGLWWLVRVALAELHVPVAVMPPATLKRYATGRGNADKAAMAVAAFKWLGIDGVDDNQVDAAWLRAAGLDRLGYHLAVLPVAQQRALLAVDWPTMPGCDHELCGGDGGPCPGCGWHPHRIGASDA